MIAYLPEAQVAALLSMGEVLGVLEAAIAESGRGNGTNVPRQRVDLGATRLHVLPASVPSMDVLGLKAFTTGPGGAKSLVILFAGSGDIVAIVEANRLGQLRTGAASGIATRYLAREDSRIVAMIGCGRQARTQLEAVCSVRDIELVLAWSRTESNAAAFAAEMTERLGVAVESVSSAKEAVQAADIVTTMTAAVEPIVNGTWIQPGTHLNAAGSNRPDHREIDSIAVANADLIVTDDTDQAKVESGDLILAAADGGLNWAGVRELGEVVAGVVKGRTSTEQITLFKSNGIGLWDVAVGARAHAQAHLHSMGIPMGE